MVLARDREAGADCNQTGKPFAGRTGFSRHRLASAGLVGRGQWRFLVRHTLQQIYFTAVQRAYMFTVVGLIIGTLMAFPLIVFRIHDPQLLGRIMHIMMYHQLDPILAALFVAGLSGSAHARLSG